jgi:hypothetical protein
VNIETVWAGRWSPTRLSCVISTEKDLFGEDSAAEEDDFDEYQPENYTSHHIKGETRYIPTKAMAYPCNTFSVLGALRIPDGISFYKSTQLHIPRCI